MSRKVLIETLSEDTLEKYSNELNVTQPPSKYAANAPPKNICLFEIENDNELYVPFAYDNTLSRPDRKDFEKREMRFNGSLRDSQKVLKKEAIEFLNKNGSVIIAAATGFGKTCTGINIACTIGLKTLIICHRVVLVNQWRDSIKKFCPNATTQIIGGKDCQCHIPVLIYSLLMVQ